MKAAGGGTFLLCSFDTQSRSTTCELFHAKLLHRPISPPATHTWATIVLDAYRYKLRNKLNTDAVRMVLAKWCAEEQRVVVGIGEGLRYYAVPG